MVGISNVMLVFKGCNYYMTVMLCGPCGVFLLANAVGGFLPTLMGLQQTLGQLSIQAG